MTDEEVRAISRTDGADIGGYAVGILLARLAPARRGLRRS